MHTFAREHLFDPLGIGPTEWLVDNKGEAIAASGLRMIPRDLARIGAMMLRSGAIAKRQIVPAEWLARSTTPVVDIDEIRSYGYHWYLGKFAFNVSTGPRWNRSRIERFWSAIGNGGQRLFLFPGIDLGSPLPPAITIPLTNGCRLPELSAKSCYPVSHEGSPRIHAHCPAHPGADPRLNDQLTKLS